MKNGLSRSRRKAIMVRLALAAISASAIVTGFCPRRSPEAAAVYIDPRAWESFRSLCGDHPLPTGLAYRFHDSPRPGRRGDLSLSFGDTAGTPREKAVSAYYPYPVKNLWEDDPEGWPELPLSEIRLPVCVRTNGLPPAAAGELLLRVGKGAPEALSAWFAGIPESTRSPMAWIAAVGDIMLDRGAQDAILSGEGGAERVFGDLLPILRNADFLVGNLEGAATEGGERADKLYTFRFRPSAVPRLKDAGFDYLALSNNHSFDYGQRGFLDGLKALRGAGIGFSGAGVRVAEALEPFRASAHGQALSLVAFGAFRPEQPAASISASSSNPGMLLKEGGLRAIRASSGPGAVDIAVVHAGTEYADAPDENIRGLYRECVDDGADIVLGSHPHVLQGAEAYRGGLIAYSLGNFVFRGMEKQPNATDTMILLIGVMDGRVAAMEPVFARIGADGPRLAPDSSGERFYGLCRALAASSGRSEAFAVPTRASSGAPASPRPRME